MPYRYKKKRYKLKPLPVTIALITLILLVFIIGHLIMTLLNHNNDNRINPSSIAVPTSSAVSSSNISSDEGSTTSSITASSKLVSSTTLSSNSSGSTVISPKQSGSTVISSKPSSASTPDGVRPAGKKADWNLILLNPDEANKIDTELDIQKTKFDTQWVDSRAAQAYKDMCAAASKNKISLYLRSGYRSMATQKRNYDNEVARQINLGNSKEEAIKLTQEYYTVSGHSEHHTGLAFDIITPEYHNTIHTLNEKFAKTDAYKWLLKNCSDYGFILRYTKDKKSVTGINFEPWHYRYVGVEHAKYMTKNSLTLEEYLDLFED